MTALINGSPKPSGSASAVLLKILKEHICGELLETALRGPEPGDGCVKALAGADTWVFAFPLYVDGIPSHLLSCLCRLQGLAEEKHPRIYAVANCGFYEGEQNRLALSVMENFCQRAGCRWCGGVGIGGGGSLTSLPRVPEEKGPMGPVERALRELGDSISAGAARDNWYVTVALPRLMYKLAGQMGWRKMIRANGGRARDLDKRIT